MRWPVDLKRISPLLLHGEGALEFAHETAEHLLHKGERIVTIDGANAFDAGHIARSAQKRKKHPPEMLNAIRVSRAFTWQAFEALVENDVLPEATRTNARWILILGPLDLLADEDVKPFQAWRSAGRIAKALTELSGNGLGVIVAQRMHPLIRGNRTELEEFLHRACAHAVEVSRRDPHGRSVPASGDPEPVSPPPSVGAAGRGLAVPAAPRPLPDLRQLVLPFAVRG